VKSRITLTVAAALLSASVFAQDQGGRTTDSAFTALDANKDARIDRDEAKASPVVTQSFAAADADHDGAITREEFSGSFTMRPSAPSDAAPPAAPLPPASSPPQ
jgi:Ca2+-binding EF-hand superfamily protein